MAAQAPAGDEVAMAAQAPAGDEVETDQVEGEPEEEGKQIDRVWNLKDCQMHVANIGKRSVKDTCMTLDLFFEFDDDPTQKVVDLKYNPEELKNAWFHCNNALETVVFLEECRSKDQKNGFIDLIHQEIKKFNAKIKIEASQGSQGAKTFRAKKTHHFYKPTVEQFGENYYLVATDIFILGGQTRKLTLEETRELPVTVSWKGPHFCFETDERKCVELLSKIFSDMNTMQNKKFVSFPLAVFVAHLSGQLYKHIIKIQGTFSTQMSVSGPSSSTGKSLMQTVNMLIFYGEVQSSTTNATESTFYETLHDGKPVFVKEFTVKKMSSRSNTFDARFFGEAVKTLWERSERRVRGKAFSPNAVMYVDGNIVPSDLEPYLTEPSMSKINFYFTGFDALDHPKEAEIVDSMLKAAKEVNKFLPVVLSIGVDNNLKKASDDDIEEIRDVLKKPHIRRQGQVIVTYDRVYRALDKAFDDHSVQKPILFQSGTIDRTSLIYFNTDQEEKERAERVAAKLVELFQSD